MHTYYSTLNILYDSVILACVVKVLYTSIIIAVLYHVCVPNIGKLSTCN
jgi:hypothetical protein